MILENLRKNIEENLYDAILLTGLENPVAAKNLYYVTGYTGSFGFAIITKDKQFMISDFRYREQVQQECKEFTFVEIEQNFLKTIEQVLEQENINVVGFDKKIRFAEYELYAKFEKTLIPLDNVVEKMRMQKSDEEIEILQKACDITDKALEFVVNQDLIGKTEREVEVLLKSKMLELGADGTWERFIVASGTRGSMPHGMASEKVIQNNEMVTFDLGCIYKGYSSDLTRTIAIGNPDPKLIEMYNVVYEAQTRAVEQAKAGMTGKELDSLCRDYITEKGYGEYFKHGTGHGLGLDVHEGQRASQLNDKPLLLNTCITVEPGVYIEGLGGIRIEDDIILKEDGCIILNKFPKELIRK